MSCDSFVFIHFNRQLCKTMRIRGLTFTPTAVLDTEIAQRFPGWKKWHLKRVLQSQWYVISLDCSLSAPALNFKEMIPPHWLWSVSVGGHSETERETAMHGGQDIAWRDDSQTRWFSTFRLFGFFFFTVCRNCARKDINIVCHEGVLSDVLISCYSTGGSVRHLVCILCLSRVYTRRRWNSRNQWKDCDKPNRRSATKDPGKPPALKSFHLCLELYWITVFALHFNSALL